MYKVLITDPISENGLDLLEKAHIEVINMPNVSSEIQRDLFNANSKIIVIDDLLATGGTASAAGKLISNSGGKLMADPVNFYFDFSSPYSYFAAQKIDSTVEACGRTVRWKPFLLGALFKLTSSQPLPTLPLKGDYCLHDWERLGQMTNTPWIMPDPFPIPTHAAGRAFYWLDEQDSNRAKAFALAVFNT